MINSDSSLSDPQGPNETARTGGFSPWQQLKGKRISYLALPLIVMATLTEFFILATGWKYQKMVCVPQGMGVTFFGIGPIGATILSVELLKLPLAIWTASRHGWQKVAMLMFGLPLICLLTFQLIKDMAVYEMGIALTPANQMLEKAAGEQVKLDHLKEELSAIDQAKADRDRKLAALAAKKEQSRRDFEEALKRNDDLRSDAISLTDYQKKELAAVQERETNLTRQFDADAAQIRKTIADLHARHDAEMAQTAKWNAEDARIDNVYKLKMAEYMNVKAAYLKEKAHYDQASFLRRQFMTEPVDPGVPPVREDNALLKPNSIAEIDAQIKTKEAELLAVDTQRRAQIAQVEADARALRENFDARSGARRSEADRRRDELLASRSVVAAQWAAEERQINQEYDAVAPKADAIRAAMVEPAKKAEEYYEAREAAIKNTQVHRIATTVEIVRGLLMGQRPVSIKATARERGDLYTDQISMVRIWVYPVLAFIIAFLPALMVEIGFSTIFEKDEKRRKYRIGFFGRRLHWLYIRAGRQKIFHAERMAREALARIAARDRVLADKTAELKAASAAMNSIGATHAEQLKKQENEWRAKLASVTDALHRAVAEKDAMVALQHSEIERQLQIRPNAWSDQLANMRKEMDNQRAAAEAERAALIEEHHKKLLEMAEDSKKQLVQARRQTADAFAVKLAQVQEDALRLEKQHLDQQRLDYEKKLQNLERQLTSSVREQEARRESEFGRELDARALDSRMAQDVELREELMHADAHQHDAEWQAKLDMVKVELQEKIDRELRRRESDITPPARRVLSQLVPGVEW